MRHNKLDLNLLVPLDALLVERNVTRAAERIHLSQSAMSNSLARLRDYFDDELLIQVGRHLELTPRAEVLREAVRDILMRIDTTVAAQPEFDPAESDREFTLFVSDYSMEILIPHALALASGQHSRARFRLLPQIAETRRSLERGEVDLLIIPKAYISSDHPAEVLFRESFLCAIWRDSQLARAELTIERYLEAGHVVMQSPENGQPAFEDWFIQRYGISRRNQVLTYNFGTLPFLVIGTELIATVHARLARRLQPSLPITLVPVPLPMPELEQMMQWHKHRSQDPGLMWLRTLIQQAAALIDQPVTATQP